MTGAARWSQRLVLASLWLGAAVMTTLRLDEGWVPFDEGTLGQSALRVLDGELPHRDFAELYTGGQAFLDAGVMALFGENLIWLRAPLLVLFIGSVGCVYAIARRFAGRSISVLVAAFAVTWGLPAYPAAVPSWYLLVFAVFGVYALLRHRESGAARWLVLAGVCGGLAITFKVNGVLFVFAAVLYLLVVELWRAADPPVRESQGRRIAVVVATVLPILGLAFVVLIVRTHFGAAEVVNLLLPVAAVAALVVMDARRLAGDRLRAFVGTALVFLGGVAVPFVLFLVPYAATGSLGDVFGGMLLTPQTRLDGSPAGYISTPSPAGLVFLAPLLVLTALRLRWSRNARVLDIVLATILVALVVASAADAAHLTVWHIAHSLAPAVVVLGSALLWRSSTRLGGERGRSAEVFLLLATAAFLALVQFPFGAPIYLCFVAPFFALAAVAVFRHCRLAPGFAWPTLLAVLVVFGLVWFDRGAIYRYGIQPAGDPHTVVLDSARASLRVTPEERAGYRRLMVLIARHEEGGYLFAGPDMPEMYVLADLRNPTRSLFDWLDPSDSARGAKLLRTLREHDVRVIVINTKPAFSQPLEAATVARLRRAYPRHERVDAFDVRWRAGSAAGGSS